MAHCVNAEMHAVQPPNAKPPVNRILPNPQVDQLPTRHHPMLTLSQRRNPRIDRLNLL